MRLSNGTHLTYCTNIHPGETWDDIEASLRRHVLAIKRAVSPTEAFGVGLHRLQQRTGQCITLALEPEPDYLLETMAETAASE